MTYVTRAKRTNRNSNSRLERAFLIRSSGPKGAAFRLPRVYLTGAIASFSTDPRPVLARTQSVRTGPGAPESHLNKESPRSWRSPRSKIKDRGTRGTRGQGGARLHGCRAGVVFVIQWVSSCYKIAPPRVASESRRVAIVWCCFVGVGVGLAFDNNIFSISLGFLPFSRSSALRDQGQGQDRGQGRTRHGVRVQPSADPSRPFSRTK